MFSHFSFQLSAIPVDSMSPGLFLFINIEILLLCGRGEGWAEREVSVSGEGQGDLEGQSFIYSF